MKKRTNEEKRELINAACDLFRESAKMIEKAKWNLHLCGIETCGGFNEKVEEWEYYSANVQLYSGICKMEKITGETGVFPNDIITEKPDRSRKILKYNDISFLQCSNPMSTRHKYR